MVLVEQHKSRESSRSMGMKSRRSRSRRKSRRKRLYLVKRWSSGG